MVHEFPPCPPFLILSTVLVFWECEKNSHLCKRALGGYRMPMLNPGGQGGACTRFQSRWLFFSHAPESCRSVPHSYMDSVALHSAFCHMEYCGRLWLARFVLPAFIIALLITSLASTAAMAPHLSAAEQDRAKGSTVAAMSSR